MPTSLRGRIVAPLALSMVVLVATFAVLLTRAHHRDLDSDLQRDLATTEAYLRGKLQTESRLMEAVLRTLSQADPIREAFLAGDRAELLRLANPVFQDLRVNHHVTHLYFSRPDRVNLLRVHRPEQYGDTIPRPTTIDAVATGRTQAGIEIGRLRGLLTLRVVLPWYHDDEVIGLLELGQEIDYFAGELKSVLGVEAFVLVPKALVDREAWIAGMAFLGREGDWDLLPDQLVSAGTLATVPEELRHARLTDDVTAFEPIEIGGRRYHSGMLPLLGRAGNQVGSIMVLRDRTEEIAAARRSVVVAVALCALVAVLLESVLRRLVARHFFFPLKDLQEVAARAGQGQLSQTVTIHRQDELGELGRAINQMILDLRQANEVWERRLVDAALDAVITLDDRGRVIGWNARAEEILEWTDQAALGEPFVNAVLAAGDRVRYADALSLYRPGVSSSPLLGRLDDVEARRADGTTFAAELSITPVVSRGSHRFAVFLRDVTSAREAEARLRESEERFRQLVETAGVLPWMAQADTGQIVYVGPQAEALLGHPIADWYEPGFIQRVVHPDDFADYVELLDKAVVKGRATLEYRMRRADDAVVWVRDIVTLTAAAAGAPRLQGFRFDITERKALEEQLFRSQKMDAIGRLAGGVAHDFNNLLTVVLGSAALLNEELAEGTTARQDLHEIIRAGERAADLTQQLLAFARKQIVRPQVVNLQERVEDLERMLKRLIGEHIDFRTSFAPDAWDVLIDPGRLEQVLVNLAVNARDAMREGGELLIEVDNVVTQSAADHGHEVPPGRYVCIAVSDTGEGMSRSVQAQIFEPFYSTKGVGEGTGLGLSTCLGIIDQARGYMRVYSEVGIGTTFRIYLPPADEAAQELAEAEAEEEVVGGGETILVAEDEPQVASLVERALAAAGYDVLVAEDGREAVEVSARADRRIDLLLTDMVMPFRDGQEVADLVRQDHHGAKVLFMSGYSEALASKIRSRPDTGDLISKPFTPAELLRRVRSTLDGED